MELPELLQRQQAYAIAMLKTHDAKERTRLARLYLRLAVEFAAGALCDLEEVSDGTRETPDQGRVDSPPRP